VVAAGILGVAVYWRAETLTRRPLWFDERWTERVVRDAPDLGALWAVGRLDHAQHPPLGYAPAWLATRGGITPARLRAPSLIAGVVSIALLAAVGAQLFGRCTGLFAALLASLSIYHVDYSQEARPYMLGVAWTLALYASLFAWLRSRRNIWLAPLALAAVAALYTYHLALLHVAIVAGVSTLAGVVSWRSGDRRTIRAPLAAVAAIGLLYLPQVPNLRIFFAGDGLAPNHVLALSPALLHAVATRWSSTEGATALLYEVVFVIGALRVAARRDLPALAVAGWAVAPIAVFSLLPFSKYFDARFLISSMPVLFLLAGAGAVGAARGTVGLATRAGISAGRAALLRDAFALGLAVALVVPAARLHGRYRNSERHCGDFVHHPEVLEADGRLCADRLMLNSIATEQQWILRSLRPSVDVAPERLDALVGTYRFENGPQVAITRRGDALVAQVEGQRAYQLVAESETRFWFRVLGGHSITFEPDARALRYERDGSEARAVRER
jgi:hypothetical protein